MVAAKRAPPAVESGSSARTNLPVVAISGRIGTSDTDSLCARVQELFRAGDEEVVAVDVSGVIDPDVAALDALARLHLTSLRMGRRIKILHTCDQLEELVAFAGLADVLCIKDKGQSE